MHPLIEHNREAIARLCRLHGVRSLEAFGSKLRDDFDAGRSDVDVLVEFEAQAADSFSNFLDLKESLEALFQRSVDLVELRAIRNRRLRYYIEQSKIIDLCRSVIPVSTSKTSSITPLRPYVSRPDSV